MLASGDLSTRLCGIYALTQAAQSFPATDETRTKTPGGLPAVEVIDPDPVPDGAGRYRRPSA
jgi:hypothetical protein